MLSFKFLSRIQIVLILPSVTLSDLLSYGVINLFKNLESSSIWCVKNRTAGLALSLGSGVIITICLLLLPVRIMFFSVIIFILLAVSDCVYPSSRRVQKFREPCIWSEPSLWKGGFQNEDDPNYKGRLAWITVHYITFQICCIIHWLVIRRIYTKRDGNNARSRCVRVQSDPGRIW